MNSLISHVDPFIGVDRGGNTLCGPHLPHSLVRLGPDTVPPHPTNGYESGKPIAHFSHTHVSGTGGGGRYGNIGVLPFVGDPVTHPGSSGKEEERAEPGKQYIRTARINGKPLDRVWIAHGEVAGGGTIRFELSHQPANWAKGVPPPSPMESRP